ncbi:hypothetical protein FRC03_012668 [Tulasnella sp. 419]|nr:hypothetical protein FRC03_012668 [Tulasnella sp. 419]
MVAFSNVMRSSASSTAFPNPAVSRKVVIVGAGFVGSHIARALAQNPSNRIQLSSRNPYPLYQSLISEANRRLAPNPITSSIDTFPTTSPPSSAFSPTSFLLPHAADVTNKKSLIEAIKDASVVVSLVGVLHGDRNTFERVQWKGVQNLVEAIKESNAKGDSNIKKVIHLSAIGADPKSKIDYFRTKALAEKELFTGFDELSPRVIIFRPSLVFGPGDGFFSRFARLSKILPFLPVFGGGKTKFQPVYVGDIASAVGDICSKFDDERADRKLVIQAGGPNVLTYRQMMERLLKHLRRKRPIISLPFGVGVIQGTVMEKLPENIFTLTRSQVEQLKLDNVILDPKSLESLHGERYTTLEEFITQGQGREKEKRLRSVDEILPTYL